MAGLLFLAFPFELVDRLILTSGYALALAFLLAFCVGAWLKTLRRPSHNINKVPAFSIVCNSRARKYLTLLSSIAIVAMVIEIYTGGLLDLSSAYQNRSSQGQALLHGEVSRSSISFKIGFLLFPVGLVYLAQEVLFSEKIPIARVCFFGFLPSLLSALALGGRATLFNAFVICILAYMLRGNDAQKKKRYTVKRFVVLFFASILTFGFILYFLQIFFERADGFGGPSSLLDAVGGLWGVRYESGAYDAISQLIGASGAFILFVLAWYLTQGIIISLSILSSYGGSAMLGAYGVDLFSAVFRRVDPNWTSNGFLQLLDMNVYGFYPAAFGSLYVDFWFLGLLVSFMWGWFCGFIFLRYTYPKDYRWHLIAPFMIFGILMSLINTPVGYSNGLVTYFWLFVSFFLLKKSGANFRVIDAGAGRL